MSRMFLWSLGFVLTLSLAGCGGDSGPPAPTMFQVTGTVKFDGADLAEGVIVADPSDKTGLPAQGAIKDGKFEFRATPGPKTVRITAPKLTEEKGQYGEDVTIELIPTKYNSDSKLSETVAEKDDNVWTITLEK